MVSDDVKLSNEEFELKMTDYLISPPGGDSVVISTLDKQRAIDKSAIMFGHLPAIKSKEDIGIMENKPERTSSILSFFGGSSFDELTSKKKFLGNSIYQNALVALSSNGMDEIKSQISSGYLSSEDAIRDNLLGSQLRCGLQQYNRVNEFIFDGYSESSDLSDPSKIMLNNTSLVSRILEINPNDPSITNEIERNSIVEIQAALNDDGGYLNRESTNDIIATALANMHDTREQPSSEVVIEMMNKATNGIIQDGDFNYKMSILNDQLEQSQSLSM